MKRIIGISILSIFLTVIDLNENLCGAEPIIIKKGDYTFSVTKESENFEKIKINDSELPCLSFNKEIAITKLESVIFSDLESITQEIEAEFDVSLSTGSDEAKLNAKIKLRNKLLRKHEVENKKEYKAQIKCNMVLYSLECFNQEVLIVYKVTKYNVKVLKKRFILNDEKKEFSFQDKVFTHLMKRYTYDETCSKKCEIHDKEGPVLGLDEEQINVMIKYENKEIYIVPLYWGRNRKIISPFILLPENVQNSVATLLYKKEESAFFRSHVK
jgi:hypothetical protein